MRKEFALGVILFSVAFLAWMWEMERLRADVKKLFAHVDSLSVKLRDLSAEVSDVKRQVAGTPENLGRIARLNKLGAALTATTCLLPYASPANTLSMLRQMQEVTTEIDGLVRLVGGERAIQNTNEMATRVIQSLDEAMAKLCAKPEKTNAEKNLCNEWRKSAGSGHLGP
jgi:regulator of replication initiation timing